MPLGMKTENNETDFRPAKSAMEQEENSGYANKLEKDEVVLPDSVTKQHIDKLDITDPRKGNLID